MADFKKTTASVLNDRGETVQDEGEAPVPIFALTVVLFPDGNADIVHQTNIDSHEFVYMDIENKRVEVGLALATLRAALIKVEQERATSVMLPNLTRAVAHAVLEQLQYAAVASKVGRPKVG